MDKDNKKDKVVVLPGVDSRGRRINIDKGNQEDLNIQQMARIERETEGDDFVDRDMAKQIMRDSAFANDLDYIDDNVERLSRKRREKTKEQQKQEAIGEYKTMESALGGCEMCFKQSENSDGSTLLVAPNFPMVSLGNRVYLALPSHESMNDGHCVIAPIEHVAGSSLKCDDNMWAEITNFMKCLMHMFAASDQGVVFIETVMSTAPAKAHHCTIECIPIPMDKAQDVQAYFKESVLAASDEWSQHRKVIDTTMKAQAIVPQNDNVRDQDDNHTAAREAIRRGGFRNTMTAKMPYFHVWFDPHGGLGHVIENPDSFPPWFGREVVAGILDLPPTVYRKPRRLKESRSQRFDRADEWKKQFGWKKFDWTAMLEE
ncbi:Pre-mRNA-splicing factor cwf19 [Coemansia sp. RSA 1358]|nr:Pre-mRNA-splicing factor cwf19 [Coemansia umbellata]KAJ2620869.1 Pre-mRNA-splicing factor cwf19 [Coemansia sp. RSA 1358]